MIIVLAAVIFLGLFAMLGLLTSLFDRVFQFINVERM